MVHLVGFITKKFVTMHGHMNVKNAQTCSLDIYITEPHGIHVPIRFGLQGVSHSDGLNVRVNLGISN